MANPVTAMTNLTEQQRWALLPSGLYDADHLAYLVRRFYVALGAKKAPALSGLGEGDLLNHLVQLGAKNQSHFVSIADHLRNLYRVERAVSAVWFPTNGTLVPDPTAFFAALRNRLGRDPGAVMYDATASEAYFTFGNMGWKDESVHLHFSAPRYAYFKPPGGGSGKEASRADATVVVRSTGFEYRGPKDKRQSVLKAFARVLGYAGIQMPKVQAANLASRSQLFKLLDHLDATLYKYYGVGDPNRFGSQAHEGCRGGPSVPRAKRDLRILS